MILLYICKKEVLAVTIFRTNRSIFEEPLAAYCVDKRSSFVEQILRIFF